MNINDLSNTFFHGNCFQIMDLIPDQSIDFICTDPPYNKTECSWDNSIDIASLWQSFNRIIKSNGCIAIFGIDLFSAKIMIENASNYRYKWIWNKQFSANFASCQSMPLRNYEEILIFYKTLPTYNIIMKERSSDRVQQHQASHYTYINKQYQSESALAIRKNSKDFLIDFGKYNPKEKYPELIIEGIPQLRPNATEKVNHPTQKPIKLFEYLINIYTNPHDIVFDPFLGSGTTLFASINTHRKYCGIELDDRYIQMIQDRIRSEFHNSIHIKKKKIDYGLQYNIVKPLDAFI